MAGRNTADGKRFVFRSPTKEPEAFFIPINGTGTDRSSRISQLSPPPRTARSADVTTPRTETANPARRVVVIRNKRQPQVDQGTVELSDFARSNSIEGRPVFTDGRKQVLLIRRPIAPPEPPKPVETQQPVEEHIRTPTPPTETVISSDLTPPSSPPSSPSTRPKSSKHTENLQRYVPYLRRPKSKPRTPSPVRILSTHPPPSAYRTRPPRPKRHSPPPPSPKHEEHKDTDPEPHFATFFWMESSTEPSRSPPPATIENEQPPTEYYITPTIKSAQRKQSASARPKSAKSVILVKPEEQSIVVIEDSHAKGEPLRSVLKSAKPFKKIRFEDEIVRNNESTEELVKRSPWQTCLGCLSRHMCLIIIICFILVLIGLAGVGVSTYFLVIDSSTNVIPKSVGLAVGGVLAIAALCFLYILLGCIGARDGYFTYKDEEPLAGGRVYAIIPPSHPNARLYIPRDYMKMFEHNHPPPVTYIPRTPSSNGIHRQSSMMAPVFTEPYTHQQTVHRSKTSTNGFENRPNKNNITIEMPDQLVTGRQLSPRSRERSLNTIVRNIGHVVEDAKKRYNGDVPNKVVVKVDQHAMQTA